MPIPYAVTAAMAAAAAAAQAASAAQTQRAMNRKVKDELNRQRGYQARAEPIVKESMEQSTPEAAAKQIQEGQAYRAAAYQDAAAQPLAGYQTPLENEMPRTIQAGNQMANQLSNFQRARNMGWSEYDIQQAIKNMRASQQLQLIGGVARDSSSVLPYELQSAQHAGDGLNFAGSMLSLGSQLGDAYSMSQSRGPSRMPSQSFQL